MLHRCRSRVPQPSVCPACRWDSHRPVQYGTHRIGTCMTIPGIVPTPTVPIPSYNPGVPMTIGVTVTVTDWRDSSSVVLVNLWGHCIVDIRDHGAPEPSTRIERDCFTMEVLQPLYHRYDGRCHGRADHLCRDQTAGAQQ